MLALMSLGLNVLPEVGGTPWLLWRRFLLVLLLLFGPLVRARSLSHMSYCVTQITRAIQLMFSISNDRSE